MYFIFSLPVLILLWLIKSNEQVGLTSHGLQLCVCHLCYISSACIRPHPLSWKSAWFPSPEIFIFPLCLHFKLAQRCLFLLSTRLVQWISFLSFFLSLPLCLCLYVPVTLSRSLMRFRSLSVLCQPPVAREQMSILSDVPCTNHPRTDTAQRRRLTQLMHVEYKCPRVCRALVRAHSLIHNCNNTHSKIKPLTVHQKHQ